jgi:hypothetical protein
MVLFGMLSSKKLHNHIREEVMRKSDSMKLTLWPKV